ncbi:MAG: VWA domain-containing protein [Phycisphaerales bacterium]|jgi:Ca-activated chloride channel family protein|nr:VWA domain-containing protein [Phycisphaerales bacterium]
MIDRFAHPEWFFALAAIPLLLAVGVRRFRPAIPLPTAPRAFALRRSIRSRLTWMPGVLGALALACIVTALARPQHVLSRTRSSTDAIAINLVVDRSLSMNERMIFDGRDGNRLDAVKHVLREFVLGNDRELSGRPSDLVGLIAFAGFADTIAPLTRSHDVVVRLADAIELAPGTAPEGGTAIGDALALAAARLRDAEDALRKYADDNEDLTIKSKVIVLMTDGENTAGSVDPLAAAELARQWGIRIYCIGIGGDGRTMSMGGRRISLGGGVDTRMLERLAETTGGQAWIADDAKTLREVYAHLDELERSRVQSFETVRAEELFHPWALAGGVLLLARVTLSATLLRRLP